MSTASPFLSDDEILQIVTPLIQPAAIVRWFRKNGFEKIKVRPNGLPLVPRLYFDQVTGINTQYGVTNAAHTQPDVEAYLNRLTRRDARRSTTKIDN